ncbi:DUF3048 domain-containing protein [Petrocella sp. FN5]|uniref:DUF3048 domain-containing protein n=1 Tax=Petrocella sp. FN5 TaxID=3032002 RepID=UPI0023DC8BFC|nr:DUF3048 domain-containing protein [Petrocella sp. FN5]MDF1618180.1 DUF3048 domain-containing protein [Petrocella sp. FN5]
MKKLICVWVLMGLIILTVGCGKEEAIPEPEIVEEALEEEETEEVEEIEEEEEVDLTGKALNPLTGLYIDEDVIDRRPVGIVISNIHNAIPQIGIEEADIIYETLVEGGITRLFAVYQDFTGEKIGPVRSARHYYLDFAFDFDAIFVHIGGSPQAYNAIRNLRSPSLDGMSSGVAYKDSSRRSPHSTYATKERIMKTWEQKGYRTDKDPSFINKFDFSEEIKLMEPEKVEKVILDFSNYHYAWFDYDPETMVYKRYQYLNYKKTGTGEHIDDGTGQQLTFDNIIIQLANIWTIKGDSAGRMDMNLLTEGEGYYLTRGEMVPITWIKKGHNEPTKYFDAKGEPLIMYPGKTWISVFPTNRTEKLLFE